MIYTGEVGQIKYYCCGVVMHGIRCNSVRRKCEDCGGNKTEYHRDNPNPEGFVAKESAKTNAS